MKRIVSSVTALFLVAAFSTAGAEQGIEPKRESFVLGFGAGWGNAGADLTIVEEVDRENGVVGDLTLGWAVRHDVVLGVEFDIWSQISGDTRWVFNLSSIGVTYFPMGENAYIMGGLGVGTSRVETADAGGSTTHQDQAGLGFAVAGGYEWWIAEEVALGPKLKWAYLDIGGDVTQNADYFSISIQLTWYKPKP